LWSDWSLAGWPRLCSLVPVRIVAGVLGAFYGVVAFANIQFPVGEPLVVEIIRSDGRDCWVAAIHLLAEVLVDDVAVAMSTSIALWLFWRSHF
jgi:hypothetical protein